MIACRELVGLLADFVGDELSYEQRVQVEAHLVVCASCSALVESYRITIRLVRRLPPHPLPPSLADRLHLTLQQAMSSAGPADASPDSPH